MVIHDSTAECPVSSSELRTHALRRRLVRSATAASAASVAAVAAFAVVLPGAFSFFSSGRTTAVAAPPCASCIKKEAVVTSVRYPPKAVAPVHVLHPLDGPGIPS
jgi:hypothetical protein